MGVGREGKNPSPPNYATVGLGRVKYLRLIETVKFFLTIIAKVQMWPFLRREIDKFLDVTYHYCAVGAGIKRYKILGIHRVKVPVVLNFK